MQNIQINTGVIRAFDCYREAWEMIKPQFGMVLAVYFVAMLIGGMVGIIMGALMCGLFLCLFDLQEGREVKIDRLFGGFQYFLPSLLVMLVVMAPVIVMMILIYIPMIGMAIAGSKMDENEIIPFIIVALIIEIIFAILMVCFHTLMMFAFPLIVDKNLSALQAMKTSAKAVWMNLGGVASLFGVGFLVTLAGMMVFCVGVYLAMPLVLAAQVVAYRKIFPGTLQPKFTEPPPPGVYQGI
jgi:MFS family permease